jgi:stress response protein YsnF
MPPIRIEGDVTIYPVVEEVLVVERRLVLREEVHVTRRRRVEHVGEDVPVRRTEARVERTTPEG